MPRSTSNLTVGEILVKFRLALDKFIQRDLYLLKHDVSERAITHKLGEYLQPQFRRWNVDCEYNRNGHEPKFVNLPEREYGDQLERVSTFPDIIVHKRGDNDHNLLIVEAKKSTDGRPNGESRDRHKLEAYARELRYKVGIFIVVTMRDTSNGTFCYEPYYQNAWHSPISG